MVHFCLRGGRIDFSAVSLEKKESVRAWSNDHDKNGLGDVLNDNDEGEFSHGMRTVSRTFRNSSHLRGKVI